MESNGKLDQMTHLTTWKCLYGFLMQLQHLILLLLLALRPEHAIARISRIKYKDTSGYGYPGVFHFSI